MESAYMINKGMYELLDVFGPRVAFLTPPDKEAVYCVMYGTIPAGVSVPLHSHPDDESFYITSGVVHVLVQEENEFNWVELKTGDFIHVKGGRKHAWRNISGKPVEGLITTTSELGNFFREVGRPVKAGKEFSSPTPDQLQYFMQVADKYDHWLGSPEENAAVGISLFA